ncbi:uncharacterized protein METZ01_LOCUS165312, partial [marine metagenome]
GRHPSPEYSTALCGTALGAIFTTARACDYGSTHRGCFSGDRSRSCQLL